MLHFEVIAIFWREHREWQEQGGCPLEMVQSWLWSSQVAHIYKIKNSCKLHAMRQIYR